jgi:hypothetical protein
MDLDFCEFEVMQTSGDQTKRRLGEAMRIPVVIGEVIDYGDVNWRGRGGCGREW